MDNIHVTSSEIGDYVYCPRGWWLRQKDHENNITPQMLRGTLAHNRLSFQLNALSIRIIIIGLLTFLIIALALILIITRYLT